VLLALRLLGDSYPRELARVGGMPINGVRMALKGLERDGLVAARPAGRTRIYRLNPMYFAKRELDQYLLKLSEPEEGLRTQIDQLRRRPRRAGKPL
jgi:DNA-binding transcriptional ArsR family regulator